MKLINLPDNHADAASRKSNALPRRLKDETKNKSDIKHVEPLQNENRKLARMLQDALKLDQTESVSKGLALPLDFDLCLNVHAKERVADSGGCEMIISAMKVHPEVEGLQEKGCAVLGSLSHYHPQNRNRIGVAGGCKVVVAAMEKHSTSLGVQRQACWAIQNLCRYHPENRRKVAMLGGCERVCSAMRSYLLDMHLQEQACASLLSLSGDPEIDSETIVRVRSCGGGKLALAAMIVYPDVPLLQEQACGVLRALCQQDLQDCYIFCAAGGPQLIASAMWAQPDRALIQEYGCQALQKLCQCTENETDKVDCSEVVIEAMKKHPTVVNIQEAGCDMLFNLKVRLGNSQVLYDGGCKAVLNAMHQHPKVENLQAAGCKALLVLAYQHQGIRFQICHCGGRSTLKAALKRYPDNTDVQINAIKLLNCLDVLRSGAPDACDERFMQPQLSLNELSDRSRGRSPSQSMYRSLSLDCGRTHSLGVGQGHGVSGAHRSSSVDKLRFGVFGAARDIPEVVRQRSVTRVARQRSGDLLGASSSAPFLGTSFTVRQASADLLCGASSCAWSPMSSPGDQSCLRVTAPPMTSISPRGTSRRSFGIVSTSKDSQCKGMICTPSVSSTAAPSTCMSPRGSSGTSSAASWRAASHTSLRYPLLAFRAK